MIEQGTFDEIVAEVEGLGREEAGAISADAMERFEGALLDEGMLTPLAEGYHTLLAKGWKWRKALYIAWARLPRAGRWPETQGELASVMGLKSARAIRTWRAKNPEIERLIKDAVVGRVLERAGDVMEAAFESATGDYKGFRDRQMLLEIMGVYKQRHEVDATVRQAAIFLPETEQEAGSRKQEAGGGKQEEEGDAFLETE
jgi:hypothetical protein